MPERRYGGGRKIPIQHHQLNGNVCIMVKSLNVKSSQVRHNVRMPVADDTMRKIGGKADIRRESA